MSYILFNWGYKRTQTRFIMQAQVNQNRILMIFCTLNLKSVGQNGEIFAGKQKH